MDFTWHFAIGLRSNAIIRYPDCLCFADFGDNPRDLCAWEVLGVFQVIVQTDHIFLKSQFYSKI